MIWYEIVPNVELQVHLEGTIESYVFKLTNIISIFVPEKKEKNVP